MIEITPEIRAEIDSAAKKWVLAADEYIDPADGLIHCTVCCQRRQTVLPGFGRLGYLFPRCLCLCQQEEEKRQKEEEDKRQRMMRIQRRKAHGLQDRYLHDYTFANDRGDTALMDKARAYVEHWDEAFQKNTGLLLFGSVGTGKSFFRGLHCQCAAGTGCACPDDQLSDGSWAVVGAILGGKSGVCHQP